MENIYKHIITNILLLLPMLGWSQYSEKQLKLAYINQFLQNIVWENEADIDTFYIGVFETDTSFVQELNTLARKAVFKNKIPIRVKKIANIPDIQNIHMMYIGQNYNFYMNEIFFNVAGKNTLLVSNQCKKANYVMINFLPMADKNLKFEIHKSNLINANFKVKDELLLGGGSEIDVAQLYRNNIDSLKAEQQRVEQQRLLISQQQTEILNQQIQVERQKAAIDSQHVEIRKHQKRIDYQRSLMTDLSVELQQQQQQLDQKTNVLLQQQKAIDEQEKLLRLKQAEAEANEKVLQKISDEIKQKQQYIQAQNQTLDQQNIRIEGQQTVLYIILASLLLFLILLYLVFRNYRKAQKYNKQLDEQKKDIQEKALFLWTANNEIKEKNAELEQKHEEIFTKNEMLQEQNEEIEQQRQTISQAYHNIEMLSEIGRQITASLNLADILAIVHTNVNQLMDATIFGIGLYDAQKQIIRYEMVIERNIHYKPYTRDMNDKNQFAVWCIENKKTILINDIAKEYHQYIAVWEGEKKFELADGSVSQSPVSMIYLPMIVKDRVIGVISVQSYQTNVYTQKHLNILETIAIYTVIALDNANAYQQIEQQKHEILEQTQLLTQANANLEKNHTELQEQREQIAMAFNELKDKNELLEQQAKQLLLANNDIVNKNNLLKLQHREVIEINKALEKQKMEVEKQKQELETTLHTLQTTQKKLVESEKMASLGNLVAGVAHEINTPVGVAITSISTVINDIKELVAKYEAENMSSSDFETFIQMFYDGNTLALKNLERTARLVQSFKQISLDQHSEQERKFNLNDYLHDILASINPEFKHTQIKIDIDCPPDLVINSYPGAFAQIFTNLLTNSKRHGFRNRNEGQINIVAKRENEKLHMEYTDNGHGITEKILPRIFDPFFTTDMQSGTGLGLNIVYNLVTQKLGGEIKCESKEGEGVKFLMTL